MRKFFYLLAVAICFGASLKAAPGDTTWVQAHNTIQFVHYGDFDTSVTFPDGTKQYRKIMMVFTLGKYACSGSGYCADWDYTISTFLMNPAGDSLELGRLISPYANISYARFPATWKQEYYFDVTDFYPALKNAGTVRVNYSGYSWGFTGNVRFAFIEGTPERNVVGVQRMWHGAFNYGKSADPISSHLPTTSLTAPSGTQSAAFKFTITGHGNDATGCSEFCKKYYQVLKDGSLVKQTDIWRDNCGMNELYPQSGTWPLNRGNWCPGASVQTNIHPLPGVSASSAFNLGLNLEPYTTPGADGASYIIDGAVVYYGDFNKATDASLEDIIAPTSHTNHFRENPRTGLTTVRVRNTGGNTINSIDFEYGVPGKTATTYTWSGTLPVLTDTILDLPMAASLAVATGTGNAYVVKITGVNGGPDDDATNNQFQSTFTAAPVYPSQVYINLKTNKSAVGSVSETEWRLYNSAGTIVKQRINNGLNATYRDTVKLPDDLYKLVVSDAGCDGINFWLYSSYPVDPGVGTFEVRLSPFSAAPLDGYFNGDFGCGFTQYFRVGSPVTIHEVNVQPHTSLEVFPNPAANEVTVQLNSTGNIQGVLRVLDYTGKIVVERDANNAAIQLNTSSLSNGLYHVLYVPRNSDEPRAQSKLVIIR